MFCTVRDVDALSLFLSRRPERHVYELGDLEAPFFHDTTWYAWCPDRIEALALLYTGQDPATLIIIEDTETPAYDSLLAAMLPELPQTLNVHASPRLVSAFAARYRTRAHEAHLKMLYMAQDDEPLSSMQTAVPAGMALRRLEHRDIPALRALYEAAYPENWFDPAMFAHSRYAGIFRGGALLAAGGTHVYAPSRGVAALGNIATHPDYRGQGLATRVTAALCTMLSAEVAHIGLNVKATNSAAISVYRRIGFVDVADYCELQLRRREAPTT